MLQNILITLFRLFTICLLLVCKTTSDLVYFNSFYAQVISLDLATFNKLERVVLLEALDFNVHIEQFEYERFLALVAQV